MTKDDFLKPFEDIRDKWLTLSGIELSVTGQLKEVRGRYWKYVNYPIKGSISTKRINGKQKTNCKTAAEAESKATAFLKNGLEGKVEEVKSTMKRELSEQFLLETLQSDNFDLGKYNFSWLESCSPCRGHGDLICGKCNGKGTVQRLVMEQVGSRRRVVSKGSQIIHNETFPINEAKHITVSCGRCKGSGLLTCSTCNGDTVNTEYKSVTFYTKPNRRDEVGDFEEHPPWVDDFYKAHKGTEKVANLIDWDRNSQEIIDSNSLKSWGFLVSIKGEIVSHEATVTATSPYTKKSTGLLKMIGGKVIDTDLIFDPHLRWDNMKSQKYGEEPETLYQILSSKLIDECYKDPAVLSIPDGFIKELNIVSQETMDTIDRLLNRIRIDQEAKRGKVSRTKAVINSVWVALAFLVPFLIIPADIFKVSHFGIIPMINTSYHLWSDALGEIYNQFRYLNFNESFNFRLMIMFIASMILMLIFGSNKRLSFTRITKWFLIGGTFLASMLYQFDPNSDWYGEAYSFYPLIDLAAISLLGGYFLARKGVYRKQKKSAERYCSRTLMAKLGQ